MYCTSCGAQNPDGAATCSVCQKPMNVNQPVSNPAPPRSNQVHAVPKRGNTPAIISLVLGIIAFFTFGFTSLIGLIFGILAINQINKDSTYEGKGLAITGTILSAISMMFTALLFAILFPVIVRARIKAIAISCTTNQRYISRAILMYSQDYDNDLPRKISWCDGVHSYLSTNDNVFHCPAVKTNGNPNGQRCDYAFNAKCSGLPILKYNTLAATPLTFDAIKSRWNQSGEYELADFRHGKNAIVSYTDGHVAVTTPEELQTAIWDPVRFLHPDLSTLGRPHYR